MRRLLSPGIPALLMAFGAPVVCAQSVPAPTTRDSAGVRIIEYATIRTTAPAFRIAPRLLAEAGGLRDDPDEEIESRTGYHAAVRFSDARIAVAEMYTVRILRADGRFVRLIGGHGGGPGQFNAQITNLCLLRGDSLLVRANRRISLFDAAGNHVKSTTAEGAPYGNCTADGRMVASAPGPNPYAGGDPMQLAVQRTSVTLKHLDREGRLTATIGTFPGAIGLIPYKIVADGFSVGLTPGIIYADNGERPEIKAYTPAGKLTAIIRWRDPLVRTTPEMLRAIALSRFPSSTPGATRDRQVADRLKAAHRTTLPAYLSFFADQAGRLWVRDYPPPPNQRSPQNVLPAWTVFDKDGILLGRYTPPPLPEGQRAEVAGAGPDHIVLRIISRDEGIRVIVQALVAR